MIALIGGTGLDVPSLFLPEFPATQYYGRRVYYTGRIKREPVLALSRHEDGRPPHKIDYLENFKILEANDTEAILSLTACGSLDETLQPETFVCPSDFVDATGRFISTVNHIHHPPASEPYDRDLRGCVINSIGAVPCGSIVSIPGPRFATYTESHSHANNGNQLINMTTATETNLALELGIPIVVLGYVTDMDHGAGDEIVPVSYDEIKQRFERGQEKLQQLLPECIKQIGEELDKRKEANGR